jgi:uncharacterized protein YraI
VDEEEEERMTSKHAVLAAAAAIAGIVASGSALAFPAYTAAHLNIRTGPGTQYPVIAQTGYNVEINVQGCLKDLSWCSVTWQGLSGWAAAQYLDYDVSDAIVLLSQAQGKVDLPVVTYTAVDLVTAGEIVYTPTAVAPVAVTVPAEVHAYVATEIVPPVHVIGEVVLGAVLPATVPLYAVPQSAYQFAFVNGQRVLVENTTRKVVYVYP